MSRGYTKTVTPGSKFGTKKLHVQAVKVEIYDTVDKVNSLNNGFLEIEYSDGDYYNKTKVKYPIISEWVDPISQSVCKAFASVKFLVSSGQVLLNNNKDYKASLDFAEYVASNHDGLTFGSNPKKQISVDRGLSIIRYGADSRYYDSYNQETGQYVPIFNNKADAMKEVLKTVKKHSGAVISGLDLVNLNLVKDSVLEELGFQEIKDELGRSPSMWMGDPEAAITLGAKRFSYGYGSGSGSTQDEKASTKEVSNSFLDILEAELA